MTRKKSESTTAEPAFWPFNKKSDGSFSWRNDTADAASCVFGIEIARDLVKEIDDNFFNTIRYTQNQKEGKPTISCADSYFTGPLSVIRIAASLKVGCRYTSDDPGAVAVFQFLMLSGVIPEAIQFVKDCTTDTPEGRDWNYTLLVEFLLFRGGSTQLPDSYIESIREVSTCIPPIKSRYNSIINQFARYLLQHNRQNYVGRDSVDFSRFYNGADMATADTEHWLVWACSDPYERLDNLTRTKDLPGPVIEAIRKKFPFALPFTQDFDKWGDGALAVMLPLLSETTEAMINKAMGKRLVACFERYISNRPVVTPTEQRVADRIFWLALLSSDPVKLVERLIKRYNLNRRVIRMLIDGSTAPRVVRDIIKTIEDKNCAFSLPPWPSMIRNIG